MKKFACTSLLRFIAFSFIALLVACSENKPVKIGFVDSLSGPAADLGNANLNGVRLAVNAWNAGGGIHGRKIELIPKDDRQDVDTAKRVVKELIAEGVVAIIGHGTSNMSVLTAPLANEAKLVMMSPTSTTTLLTDKYDYFFRVIGSTKPYAEKMAHFRFNVLKERRLAAVYDAHNSAYSESWLHDFQTAFQKHGGKLSYVHEFDETKNALDYEKTTRQLLGSKPDGILLIMNAHNAGLMAKAIRKQNKKITIGTSEWAATESLVKFGCDCVGGLYSTQFIDRESKRLPYLKFKEEFESTYKTAPGFGGVAGHDAANVIFESLKQKRADESLAQAILRIRHFDGLQNSIAFNNSTTASRPSYITTILHQRFRTFEH